MPLDELCTQVKALTLKPGDIVQIQLSRRVTAEELDAIRDGLFRILPEGVKAMVTPPEMTISITQATPE